MKMPPMVMAASSNPAYYLGIGAVDEAELPALIEKLKSSDPMVRADAADDLRRLGPKAKTAQDALGQAPGRLHAPCAFRGGRRVAAHQP